MKNLLNRTRLYGVPLVHHQYAVGDIRHHAHVVGDKNHPISISCCSTLISCRICA